MRKTIFSPPVGVRSLSWTIRALGNKKQDTRRWRKTSGTVWPLVTSQRVPRVFRTPWEDAKGHRGQRRVKISTLRLELCRTAVANDTSHIRTVEAFLTLLFLVRGSPNTDPFSTSPIRKSDTLRENKHKSTDETVVFVTLRLKQGF